MAVQYSEIQELLRSRADLHARLNLMPYDGTPEIKERGDGKYLYVRKRVAGKQTSTYVGAYTEELYNLLLRNAREVREIRKSLRSIEKQLAAAGYSEDELSADVVNNIAFARANMKMNIYDQAVLEGVATSFPQTEEIIENGKVSGMTATDVQKILNLKDRNLPDHIDIFAGTFCHQNTQQFPFVHNLQQMMNADHLAVCRGICESADQIRGNVKL